jgi:hypothetical protein
MLKNNINYILISHLKTLIFRLRNSFNNIIIIKEININYFIKNNWWLYYLYIVLYIYVTITDLWRKKKKKNTKRCEPSVWEWRRKINGKAQSSLTSLFVIHNLKLFVKYALKYFVYQELDYIRFISYIKKVLSIK